jgi:hypothetical protein
VPKRPYIVGPARKGESNYEMFDRYTLMHAGIGAALGAAGVSPGLAFWSTVGWEIVEPQLKRTNPRLFPKSSIDSAANKVGDFAAFMGAYFLMRERESGTIDP